MARRLAVTAGFILMALAFAGCASFLDPQPSQPCTLFGCNEPGNIIREVGGMIVFMGIIAAAITAVVKRLTK